MVPKESRFNQKQLAAATARDGEVIQMQHFCHQGETICHPNSSYVITKLYGTSTCGCNDNTIFQKELLSCFLPSTYATHVRGSSRE